MREPTADRRGRRHSPRIVAVAIVYVMLWSSAFIATKVGVSHSPPLTLLAVRFLVAAGGLGMIAVARGLALPREPKAWGRLALFGLLNSALYLGCTYEALRHLSAGMGSIIAATNPLLLALLAPKLLGERLSAVRLIGLALGFGGVVFVMIARLGAQARVDTPEGIGLSLSGVIFLIGATMLYKIEPPREHPLVVNCVQLAAAGIALVPAALLVEHPQHIRVDAPLVLAFLYLVVVISIGASLLWFWLLEQGEASVASSYYFLTPIFGLGLAAVLLGEPFGPRDALGLAAVAAGIALISRPTHTSTT